MNERQTGRKGGKFQKKTRLDNAVQVSKLPGEQDGHDAHADSLGGVDIDKVGVVGPDGQDHTDQGTKGVGGQEQTHDNRLELRSSRAESKLETGGRGENLRYTDQDVGG